MGMKEYLEADLCDIACNPNRDLDRPSLEININRIKMIGQDNEKHGDDFLCNTVPEKLLSYLAGYQNEIKDIKIDLTGHSPYGQLSEKWPTIKELVKATESEFGYELSESMRSWAVITHFKYGLDEYNKMTGLNLMRATLR